MGGNNTKQLEADNKKLAQTKQQLEQRIVEERLRFDRIIHFWTPRWLRPGFNAENVPPELTGQYSTLMQNQIDDVHNGCATEAKRHNFTSDDLSSDPSKMAVCVGASQTTINWSGKAPLGDDLCVAAVVAIRQSTTLSSILLNNCDVSDVGASLIGAVLHQAPPTLTMLNLSGNSQITTIGAAKLISSLSHPLLAERAGPPMTVDLRGCQQFWAGTKCQCELVDQALSQVYTEDGVGGTKRIEEAGGAKKTAHRLLLPEKPIPPFDVEGTLVNLNDFKRAQNSANVYLPMSLPNGVTIHREDVIMTGDRGAMKATTLTDLLETIVAKQRASKVKCNGEGCGSHHLAKVYFVGRSLNRVTIVAQEYDMHDSYCNLVSKYSLPDRVKYEAFIQLCQAVKFLHDQGAAIRELRPNLFIVKRKKGSDTHCRYYDFSPLRAETSRTRQVSLTGINFKFSDPAMLSNRTVTRKWDLYAVGMMILLAYKFINGATQFSEEVYQWLSPQIAPIDEQIEIAKEHYMEHFSCPEPVADIVVQLTRSDLDNRISLEKTIETFVALLAKEPVEQ